MTNSGGDDLHLRPPHSKFWGTRPPRPPPVIYAHDDMAMAKTYTAAGLAHWRLVICITYLLPTIVTWQ